MRQHSMSETRVSQLVADFHKLQKQKKALKKIVPSNKKQEDEINARLKHIDTMLSLYRKRFGLRTKKVS